MRIRRIRYCAPYEVEDDNPYRDQTKPPRKDWQTWREVDIYDDVGLRQLSPGGQQPGLQFQLRIPMTDPETDTDRDADGDRALLRIVMVGAEMSYHGSRLVVKGFVSKEELLSEEEYRKGNLDGVLAAGERYDLANEYVCEEWQEIR